MLSVLHVMSRMMPSGTELQLAGMLRAANGKHWTATLCVLHPGFGLGASLADDGIEVVELDGRSRVHLDRMRDLRHQTRGGRFDVVHTSLWGAGAFGRASVVGPRRPAVVMSERRVEDFRPRRLRLLDRGLAAVTDEWIGNSRDVCDFILRAHGAAPERVHLVCNGIDTTVFRPKAGPAPGSTPSGTRPARIGALGRLVHQKGFDVLLEALPMVLSERDVHLVIAGDGELRGELERSAHGLPVTLLGTIDGAPAVADYLRGLDLFVMPSRYEGMPNAVIEALACGVPVVATDSPGMTEATGSAARLVPPEDPRRLADAIVRSLDDPVPGPAPGVRSFDDVADGHRQVFESAAARRKRS
jgi:glycosyltransferase involved in cell wall biosynthesis